MPLSDGQPEGLNERRRKESVYQSLDNALLLLFMPLCPFTKLQRRMQLRHSNLSIPRNPRPVPNFTTLHLSIET
jgi:hypothetical protein